MTKVMSTKGLPALLAAVGTIVFTCIVPGNIYAKVFPNVDYVDWNGDADRNRIDDRLEVMARDADPVDAVILFNRCLTTQDIMFVGMQGAAIEYVGKYVQGIWVEDVPVSTLLGMLGDPYGDANIFRIELSGSGHAALNVSCRAVKARFSTTYSPNTAWDLGYVGFGAVVAILDSGVDDGHPAFQGAPFVAGYDFTTTPYTVGNPDDDQSTTFHGTHVAGTALGCDPNMTYMGVGCSPSLVDAKIIDNTGTFWGVDYHAAMDWCIEKRQDYDIDIINLSIAFYNTGYCNGKCVNCMKVDKAVDAGLVVCVAAGNQGNVGYITCPAAADRAITVGALDDQGTVARTDDTRWTNSNRGPRTSDGDDDGIDEEKPDVVAPGAEIMAPKGVHPGQNPGNIYQNLWGTSMATPHVSGAAALMLAAKPSLTPDDVKAILRQTSRNAAQTINPAWTAGWGKGEIDCYEATMSAVAADLYINSWVGDIYTPTSPPKVGVTTNLNAKVRNNGPNNANGVVVLFFTNRNNVGYGGWSQIGQTTINVPNGGMTIATVPWTPLGGHQCIRARAVYSGDANLNNNQGQDNFDPKPSEFFVEAGTPFTGPQLFRLNINSHDLLVEDGWDALVYSEDHLFDTLWIDTRDIFDILFDIDDDCCPRIIRVEINHPPDADTGQSSQLVLEGWVDDPPGGGDPLMVGQQILMSYVPGACDCGAWGDVNDDTEINPIDVVYMVNYVYKNRDDRVHPPDCPYEAGDVNCDEAVNPIDVVRYVNYVYKNITPWPCEGCGTGALPDLSITEDDFYINPDPVEVGQPVWIGVNMHNIGGATAYAPQLDIYQGDPDAGGTLLGNATTIDLPPGGESGHYGGLFIFDTPGTVEIYGIADIVDAIAELNENNNKAFQTLEVVQPSRIPMGPVPENPQGPVRLQPRR